MTNPESSTEPVACPGDVVATTGEACLVSSESQRGQGTTALLAPRRLSDGGRERPILFSAPMVRALLAGTKTQTRRIIKPQPARVFSYGSAFPLIGEIYAYNSPDEGWMLVRAGRQPRENVLVARCPYGVPGDALWVREAHALIWPDENPPEHQEDNRVEYRADTNGRCLPGDWPDEERGNEDCAKWRPSIHMPRWASRITLKITDVRVERLNDISEADARAEGLQRKNDWLPMYRGADDLPWCAEFPRDAYRDLWERINGEGSWSANPWCWAVSFDLANAPEGA